MKLEYRVTPAGKWKKTSVSVKATEAVSRDAFGYQVMFSQNENTKPDKIALRLVDSGGNTVWEHKSEQEVNSRYKNNPATTGRLTAAEKKARLAEALHQLSEYHRLEKLWLKVFREQFEAANGRKPNFGDANISGIGSDSLSYEAKEQLRAINRKINAAMDSALSNYKASGKRNFIPWKEKELAKLRGETYEVKKPKPKKLARQGGNIYADKRAGNPRGIPKKSDPAKVREAGEYVRALKGTAPAAKAKRDSRLNARNELKEDKRYTVTLEHTGDVSPRYVARFMGTRLGDSHNVEGAIWLAQNEKDARMTRDIAGINASYDAGDAARKARNNNPVSGHMVLLLKGHAMGNAWWTGEVWDTDRKKARVITGTILSDVVKLAQKLAKGMPDKYRIEVHPAKK